MNSETYTSIPFIVSKRTAELWYRKPDVPGHHMIAGVPRDMILQICCLYQSLYLSFWITNLMAKFRYHNSMLWKQNGSVPVLIELHMSEYILLCWWKPELYLCETLQVNDRIYLGYSWYRFWPWHCLFQGFCGFSQLLEVNARFVLQLSHSHLLLYPFQFIIH
jgi:hypothetical protein